MTTSDATSKAPVLLVGRQVELAKRPAENEQVVVADLLAARGSTLELIIADCDRLDDPHRLLGKIRAQSTVVVTDQGRNRLRASTGQPLHVVLQFDRLQVECLAHGGD
jgi:hypothetical protein